MAINGNVITVINKTVINGNNDGPDQHRAASRSTHIKHHPVSVWIFPHPSQQALLEPESPSNSPQPEPCTIPLRLSRPLVLAGPGGNSQHRPHTETLRVPPPAQSEESSLRSAPPPSSPLRARQHWQSRLKSACCQPPARALAHLGAPAKQGAAAAGPAATGPRRRARRVPRLGDRAPRSARALAGGPGPGPGQGQLEEVHLPAVLPPQAHAEARPAGQAAALATTKPCARTLASPALRHGSASGESAGQGPRAGSEARGHVGSRRRAKRGRDGGSGNGLPMTAAGPSLQWTVSLKRPDRTHGTGKKPRLPCPRGAVRTATAARSERQSRAAERRAARAALRSRACAAPHTTHAHAHADARARARTDARTDARTHGRTRTQSRTEGRTPRARRNPPRRTEHRSGRRR